MKFYISLSCNLSYYSVEGSIVFLSILKGGCYDDDAVNWLSSEWLVEAMQAGIFVISKTQCE